MNPFNNKITRATRHIALMLLASFLLVSSCGKGGTGTATQGISIQAGVVLTKPLMDIAMVGQPYANTVALLSYDPLNKVVSLSITNPTAGGSPPAIDNVGNVTWTANDIDFANTQSLRITVKMEQGADVLLDTPVDVRNERTVYEVVLDPNEASYIDTKGRYMVQTKKLDPTQPIAGSLKITEIFSGDGSFKPQYYLYNWSNVDLVFVEEPVSILPAQPSVSSASVTTSAQSTDATYPLTSLNGLKGIPSVVGSIIKDGLNVYTSRTNLSYSNSLIGNTKIYVRADFAVPFNFLGSCYDQATCTVPTGTPVILIHGFTPENVLIPTVTDNGGNDTWGTLPSALMSSVYGHAVFEMRWKTQMRFEEAAGKLLEFSKAVAILTGKKPMIIAHSFGGIVAHLALKGEGWIYNEAGEKWKKIDIDIVPTTVISQLITLDSPLSGISETIQLGDTIWPGFTVGRHYFDSSINTCGSVTCVQAGSFDQGLDALTLNIHRIDPAVARTLAYGESIKRIQTGVTTIPFFTVVGTNQKPYDGLNITPTSAYQLDDGLISLMGQAVDPTDFAVDPYNIDKNFQIKFLSNTTDLDAYDNLAVGTCLDYTSNNHSYWICPRAAHTTSTIHRTFRSDYSIAYYEIPIEGGASHPLEALIADTTKIAKPKENYINTPPPASIVRGRTIQYIVGVMRGVSHPILVTFTDRFSGVSSGRLASSASAGNFEIDIGKLLVDIYGGTANLDNYTVKLKMGDGLSTRIYTQTISNLQALQELGNIDLTLDTTPLTVPGVTLTAMPSSIANGARSSLSWSSTHSTSCNLSGGWGIGTTGSFTTPHLTATTTYTVTCTGAGGTASQSAVVTVAASPSPSPPPPPTTGTLNDTGITASQCYQAGSDILVACDSVGVLALNSAQDGVVGRDANAATNSATDGKLGFSFTAVADGANPHGCVQDNVTGLMWEVKTADGGLHDWNKTYTNYDSTLDTQKNNDVDPPIAPTQAEIDAPTNSIGFKNSVNAQGLCGFGDWRLPSVDELQSIMDYSVPYPGPTIDTTWFPNTQGSPFWTASPDAGIGDFGVWDVHFYLGDSDVGSRNDTHSVRLVRASQLPIPNRYSVSADGQEVTDNKTKLIWRRCAEGMNWDGSTCAGVASTFTHEAALRQAAAQTSSTGIAWRLPNVKELSSIAERSRINPAIDLAAFPATPSNFFWSASPVAGIANFAWVFYFHYGYVNFYFRNFSLPVRLVRAAP